MKIGDESEITRLGNYNQRGPMLVNKSRDPMHESGLPLVSQLVANNLKDVGKVATDGPET